MTNRVHSKNVVPPDPAWRKRLAIILLGLLLLWPQLVITEFRPWTLLDAQSLSATGHFLTSFFPPAHDPDFLLLVLQATWQTIAMATAGVSLAIMAAIPMTLLITEQLSVSSLYQRRMHHWPRLLRQAIRWLLVLLRSVPELVWALLFVRITGLGPTAGVLAIALTYCGMLGKVYAEIIDATDAHVSRTLLVNGSSRRAAFLYGILPAAASELLSYTLYRWECAIRGSVVMGFVGAGGLGQRMDESMKMLAGAEVSTMLLVFVLLVAVADAVSQYFRKALA
ncbi:PhnE/PtxC family ABC transporter permease [Undibacterium griseum]|uniref:ABC transporter permease subunit n=1 Tax=Undibacterium griseum TaxID=2762295 RepID=A0ABR6YR13_9BURK|nr:ABC transporter permease subunit [Undibacterium griseum]MBC3886350.1 ABC transporter permease subunit [Undibacterium griseum]